MNIEGYSTEQLISEMQGSDSIVYKHKVASLLSKRESELVVPALVEQIKDERNNGYMGRFVFACDSFDCSEYLELFVDLIINGSYEVSMTAEMVLEGMEFLSDKSKVNTALSKLKSRDFKGGENLDNIQDAISYLNGFARKQRIDCQRENIP